MAALIPAETVVAALLFFGDGVTWTPLENAVRSIEAWQEGRDRHFGTWRHDVRSSLGVLWFDDEEVRVHCTSAHTVLDDLSLAEGIPILLKYRSFYANDEGAYWMDRDTPDGADTAGVLGAFPLKSSEARGRMRRFFAPERDRTPAHVLSFLGDLGLGPRTFRQWSRPGFSS